MVTKVSSNCAYKVFLGSLLGENKYLTSNTYTVIKNLSYVTLQLVVRKGGQAFSVMQPSLDSDMGV